ncbi:DUF6049 family protein [Ruania albidiflava]|uniref:DUF6049 family protein n=1 Tax=Ruania albidiflava TaxID=366586 RepID=UPI00146D0C2A|nr:DUF6049 family protein [Ruania albidiflava]
MRAAVRARSGTAPARGPRCGVLSRVRRATGVLVAWLVVAATVLGGWTPAHADEAPQSMDVQITDMTPAVLRPGDDWVIRGTVTNTGSEELSDPVLRLRFQTYVPSTRSALAAWNVSGDSLITVVLAAQQLGTDLRPGEQHSYEITLTAEESPFYPGAAWGPRGIAIEATSGDVQAAERTTVLWYPDEQQVTAPTELSVLVPLTATAQEWTEASSEGTTLAEAAADRLGAVLQATANPRISWALDPALLEAQPLGAEAATRAIDSDVEPGADETSADQDQNGPTGDATTSGQTGGADEESGQETTSAEENTGTSSPTGTDPAQASTDDGGTTSPEEPTSSADEAEAPTTGTELVDQLANESGRHDLIALAYADADQASLSTDAGSQLARAGQDRSGYLFGAHDIHPIEQVLWPSRYDLQSLDTVARSGVDTVVLPADSQPAPDITYTPSGRAEVSTGAGTLETALWDTGLSGLFTSDLTPLQIRQDLLAQTAIITRERPSDGRGLLAVAADDVGIDPERLHAVTEALAAAQDAPWLQLTNLRSLLGRTDSSEPREEVPAEPTTEPALDHEAVEEMSQVWSTLEAHVAITDAPQRYLGTVGPNVLGTVSATLASHPDTQQLLREAATDSEQQLQSALTVESGSSVLLVSAAGDLPISIQSQLPVPADVTVRLVPADPRLRAEQEVTATLRPNSTTTVRIPVTAVSNGNVDVHFEVLTPGGQVLLASGEPFSVRVRADWESTGTVIVASLLVIGFIIGLIRTIRRGRPQTRAAAAATSGQKVTVEDGPAATEPPTTDEHDDRHRAGHRPPTDPHEDGP